MEIPPPLLRSGEVPDGSLIVAGQNFGSGSSREQAASTLQGHRLVVIARGFARIFLQNAVNLGLRTVCCPKIEAGIGDDLEVSSEQVVNKTSGMTFAVEPLPQSRQAVVEAGGLIAFARKRLLEQSG